MSHRRAVSEYPVTLAPASRWGLSCAESACMTDLKGRSSLVAQDGPTPLAILHFSPAEDQAPAGLSCARQGMRGSHCAAAAVEVLAIQLTGWLITSWFSRRTARRRGRSGDA